MSDWQAIDRNTPLGERILLDRGKTAGPNSDQPWPVIIGQWVRNFREGEGAWADDAMREITPRPVMWATVPEGPA